MDSNEIFSDFRPNFDAPAIEEWFLKMGATIEMGPATRKQKIGGYFNASHIHSKSFQKITRYLQTDFFIECSFSFSEITSYQTQGWQNDKTVGQLLAQVHEVDRAGSWRSSCSSPSKTIFFKNFS